jgi:hypothetical protein
MHEDDSSSASSSRHSPLGSPRSKPHNASPSLLPLTLLEPIVEDTMDLKTSVTTEQVQQLQPHPPAPPRATSPPDQDVLFGAQHLKAKALGLPSLAEMQANENQKSVSYVNHSHRAQGHDVHLLTCSALPHGWVESIGGMVAARSVRCVMRTLPLALQHERVGHVTAGLWATSLTRRAAKSGGMSCGTKSGDTARCETRASRPRLSRRFPALFM